MDLNSEDKKKLFSMFKNMDTTASSLSKVERTFNSDILLVDGLNSYFRAFMAMPSLNENGLHVGGISGFLQSVGYAIKVLNPTRVIIIFDGTGGSMRRRQLYPEYKNKRSTKLRYNRAYEELSTEELEEKGIQQQLLRLVSYLHTLPVTIASLDHVEADDTIAYCAKDTFKESNRVYIMSSDKDFLQLVDDRIQVWSPTKKKLYGCAEIMLEYGISCENFINYRILSGDENDNIPGITGGGLKTIQKCFPIFSEHIQFTTDEILQYCEVNKTKYKFYRNILEEKDSLSRNYQLMQLKNTQLQSFTQLRVNEVMNKPVDSLNRIKFSQLINEDQMWNNLPHYHTWLSETFGRLNTNVITT